MVVIGQAELEDLLLSGKQIEAYDLSAIDWSDLPSRPVRVRDCTFTEARLTEAELFGAVFENCSFVRCAFPGAILTDARFTGCSFFDAENGKGCDFGRTDLSGARFANCNLTVAQFAFAQLFDARFERCKAQGADFEGADFSRRIGGRVAVSRAVFIGSTLDMVNFRHAKLDDCLFTAASLRQADLRQVSLASADLRDANLSEANLDGAVLDNADLRGASVFGLDITRLAGFENVKMSRSQLSDVVKPLGIRVFPD